MIRKAEEKDLKEITQLILVILKDMELDFLKEVPEQEILEMLQEAALIPDYRYSLKRGLVYEKNGEVAGVAFGYPDTDEPIIDLPLEEVLAKHGLSTDLKLFIDPETFPNEWYLDSISVAKKFQNQGIGTRLLEAIPQLAKESKRDVIGLACDKQNPNAKRLYERNGFKSVGVYQLSGHDYDHMQKKI